MAKSADAFRTISEVADWLGSPAHVLRFWESRFAQVKPVKRAGGRRYYRPDDMLLLGGIKKLLHEDGLTIKGVQKILKEDGIKKVAAMSHPLDENADAPDIPTETQEMPPAVAVDETVPEPVAADTDNTTGTDQTSDELDLQDDIEAFISTDSPAPTQTATPPEPESVLTPPEPELNLKPEPEPEPEPEKTVPVAAVNPEYTPQPHPVAPPAPVEPAPVVAPKPMAIETPPDPDDDDQQAAPRLDGEALRSLHQTTHDEASAAKLAEVYQRLTALRNRIKSDMGPNNR